MPKKRKHRSLKMWSRDSVPIYSSVSTQVMNSNPEVNFSVECPIHNLPGTLGMYMPWAFSATQPSNSESMRYVLVVCSYRQNSTAP